MEQQFNVVGKMYMDSVSKRTHILLGSFDTQADALAFIVKEDYQLQVNEEVTIQCVEG
jgi:hypothetical protein